MDEVIGVTNGYGCGNRRKSGTVGYLLNQSSDEPSTTTTGGGGRTARWLLLLSEFDITYVTKKSIKGRAIAEHLAEHPIKEEHEFKDCFPDEEIAVTEEEGMEIVLTLMARLIKMGTE